MVSEGFGKGSLDEALDTVIRMSVIQAFEASGEGKSMIEMLVDKALDSTVEVRDGYSKKDIPFIEYHTTYATKQMCEKVISKILEEQREEIEGKIREAAIASVTNLSTDIVNGIIGDDWRADLNVRFGKD